MTAEKGTNGIGQRTRMDDGSGYTAWSYDARGRVSEVYQSVTGGGNFRTQWGYNSADLPVWMRYPLDNGGNLGETVNYTYNTQMLLDRVYGTDTYVDDTWYDTAGRITLRELGANYTLGQTYTYYPWTQQGGRLQNLKSGIALDTDSLQNLIYSYDSVGNVETISDYHATSNPSDPQVQAFGYDDLDRLINAQATNGETTGRYPQQSYGYNGTTGNMATNAGMDYAYTYPNAPAGVAPVHGVRQVTGGIVYNGTVTVRARRGTGCTTLPVMKLYVNGTLREQWTVNKNSYLNYSVPTSLTTDAQVDVVFSNATSGCTLQVDYVTFPTATGTRTVQAESGGTIFDRGAEAGAPGANAFDGVNVINGAELMIETGSLRFVVGLNALAAGYDANGNMTLRLKDGARYFLAYDAESRLTSVSGTVSASFTYNGDGQRVTATFGTAASTAYIGGYFEWQSGAGKSYYVAGGQRVAMRTGTEVKFLLGDHLSSTSVTALASGAFDTETRYFPWGGVRWSSGASPTDYRFTGQQEIATIRLYFYNARWYDCALGRFVQADTIIPQQQGSQAWDRYAYVNNNPVRYNDPSGYEICTDDGNCNEYSISAEIYRFGIFFMGDWSDNQVLIVMAGVGAVVDKLGSAVAFQLAYGIDNKNSFIFEMGPCEECNGKGAYTHDARHVEFYYGAPFYIPGGNRSVSEASESNIHAVVHELGHAFAGRFLSDSEKNPYKMTEKANFSDGTSYLSNVGYAASPDPISASGYWRANSSTDSAETYANMFVGWVYDAWAGDLYGDERSGYMVTNMTETWLPLFIP